MNFKIAIIHAIACITYVLSSMNAADLSAPHKMALTSLIHSRNAPPERIPDTVQVIAATVQGVSFKTTDSQEQNFYRIVELLQKKYSTAQVACCNSLWYWHDFKEHVKYAHRTNQDDENYKYKEVVVCPACKGQYTNLTIGRDHIAVHSLPKLFSCPFCEINFESATYLKRHFPCDINKKQRKRPKKNNVNTIIDIPSEDESEKDDTIPELNEDLMKKAREKVDSAIGLITCEQTQLHGWTLAVNHFSANHAEYKSPRSHARKYQCPDCERFYNSSVKALECYLTSQNKNIFVCNRCQKQCDSRQDYVYHAGLCTADQQTAFQPTVTLTYGAYFMEHSHTNNNNQP